MQTPPLTKTLTTQVDALSAYVDMLVSWYWEHGSKRTDCAAASWLNDLYSCHDLASSLRACCTRPRTAWALWGPSQAGKSTFLSRYIDQIDRTDAPSLIAWPGGETAALVPKAGAASAPQVILNPWNNGFEASACITRFRLSDTVEDPRHPVEIHLASWDQMMHALACGYLSECIQQGADGAEVFLSLDVVRSKLASEPTSGERPQLKQEVFHTLHLLARLLEMLIDSGAPRYRNLSTRGVAAGGALRQLLMEFADTFPDERSVFQFAYWILWDEHEPLCTLFEQVRKYSDDIKRRFAEKRIFCSLDAASLFLDIFAQDAMTSGNLEMSSRYCSRVNQLTLTSTGTAFLIGTGGHEPLFSDHVSFALFQGVIQELDVPLRKDSLTEEQSSFRRCLEHADLLDFPGVSPIQKKIDSTKLDLKTPPSGGFTPLHFKGLIKQGRTASIVASYSRNLSIDGFCIFARLSHAPPHPEQLLNGVTCWLNHFTRGARYASNRSPLPINLVVTFVAKLVNDVLANGQLRNGFGPTDKFLGELGKLADPAFVHNVLSLNYRQFPDGKIHGTDDAISRAIDVITSDPVFQSRFGHGGESFRQACLEAGGTDYLLDRLTEQMPSSRRWTMCEELVRDGRARLKHLIEKLLPGADSVETRREAIDLWRVRLERVLAEGIEAEPSVKGIERSRRMSTALRAFTEFAPDRIEPLPRNLGKDRQRTATARAFIINELERWKGGARSRVSAQELPWLAFDSYAELDELLAHLANSIDVDGIALWLGQRLERLSDQSACERARHLLGVRMSNEFHPQQGDFARSKTKAMDLLREAHNRSDRYESSPHYWGFIQPFLRSLEMRAGYKRNHERSAQPGDAVLRKLVEQHPDLVAG